MNKREGNYDQSYYEKKYQEMLDIMSKMISEIITIYELETGEVVSPELTKIVSGITESIKANANRTLQP
jgi:hypothetical protein